jgi:lysozyme
VVIRTIPQHMMNTLLVLVTALCCACLAFCLAGCQSEEDQPTSAEQAQYEGKTLYQYNLDRGALALNDYDYSNLTTYGNFKYYLKKNNVVSKVGIDVSDNQKSINWSEVKAGGVDFAMIRIGYRGFTEGKVSDDDSYAKNIKEAKDAGLKVGVYFFSQATTEAEAKEEATYVVDKLGNTGIDYPVVFDLETDIDDNARTKDLSSDQITANTLAFCKAIKTAGYTPMIYLNKEAATHQFDLSQLQDYPFWYAEYADEPTLGFDFAAWQFTNKGSCFGVDGDVDLDILFDESKLQAKDSSGDDQAS